ncbi:hypothetical protein PMAYCL1PPCAC_27074, partial [Pristionchus mayeri]
LPLLPSGSLPPLAPVLLSPLSFSLSLPHPMPLFLLLVLLIGAVPLMFICADSKEGWPKPMPHPPNRNPKNLSSSARGSKDSKKEATAETKEKGSTDNAKTGTATKSKSTSRMS